ncbi:MAG: hypothetical protein M1165_00970, partial [Candidatus Pacearchaeota archaeon]|nr:hypothetical protein [Candidatus Pacearchaeota archaeon]
EFISRAEKCIKSAEINASIFIGGSFAKKTLVKKDKYDVDIFVRFGKEYSGRDISGMTYSILEKLGLKQKIERIHGSRDYFKIEIEPWAYLEIVPVLNVSKPKDAENITDLSYYHVKYMKRKLNERLRNDIILAKSFCHANRVYGAESHIKGFSGYSLELLIVHYKSFINFVRGVAKAKEEKIIIDMEKHYSGKRQILMDINSSKLQSPIILIDPTFKQRNALATLSDEVFERFRLVCREFLKKPDIKFFRIKETDFAELEKSAKKSGYDFILLKIATDLQEGAIAGSKLLKMHKHLSESIGKYFEIKEEGFFYKDKKDADCFFIAKRKEKIIISGPPEKMGEEVKKFRQSHNRTFTKKGRIYAEEKIKFNLKEFFRNWKEKNSKIIKDMYITKMEIG